MDFFGDGFFLMRGFFGEHIAQSPVPRRRGFTDGYSGFPCRDGKIRLCDTSLVTRSELSLRGVEIFPHAWGGVETPTKRTG